MEKGQDGSRMHLGKGWDEEMKLSMGDGTGVRARRGTGAQMR